MNTRRKWFQDRIGKRIFRGHTCSCEPCKIIEQTGLIVQDELHADYLCEIEAEYNYEGHPLRYVDTTEPERSVRSTPPVSRNPPTPVMSEQTPNDRKG